MQLFATLDSTKFCIKPFFASLTCRLGLTHFSTCQNTTVLQDPLLPFSHHLYPTSKHGLRYSAKGHRLRSEFVTGLADGGSFKRQSWLVGC